MIPANLVYQKNKSQDHDCYLTFFRPIQTRKNFFISFFRNL